MTCIRKICSQCHVDKPVSEFRLRPANRDGRQGVCHLCERAYRISNRSNTSIRTKRFHERHPNKKREYQKRYRQAHPEQIDAARIDYRKTKRAGSIIYAAKKKAREKRVPFDLSNHTADINRRINAGRCEMTGVMFDLTSLERSWCSPSVHRVVPSKGYVYSNIRIVCWGMNAALGTWGEDALMTMLLAWQREVERKNNEILS